MANRTDCSRRGLLAIVVSVLVHAAVLLGFSLVSARQDGGVRADSLPACLTFASLENDDGSGADGSGEISFVGAPAADPLASVPDSRKPGPSSEAASMQASLRAPWEFGAGAEPTLQTRPGGQANSGTAHAGFKFFEVGVGGQRLVYLLDGSMSMGKKNALELAGRELVRNLKQLPASARFQVIVYNHRPQYLLPNSFRGWLAPTPDVIADVARALAARMAEGGTDHGLALWEAFMLNPCPDTVFLLTDADDLRPEHVRRLNDLNHGRAIVHTIELSTRNRGRPDMPLQRLAADNRGTYQAIELER